MDFTRQCRVGAPFMLLALMVAAATAVGQQNNQPPANQQQNQAQPDPKQQTQAQKDQQQAQQQDKQSGQPGAQQEAEQKPVPRELRIFELQHRKPAEIQQLLGMRRSSPLARQEVNVGRASRPSELEEGPVAAVASDADSKALFVRGTAEQIQTIEGLVKAVDVPADQFKAQTIGDKHLIPISGDGNTTQRILSTLSQLQLSHQVVQQDAGALVVISDDGSGEFQSLTEQTQQVITALQKSQQNQKQAADAAAQQPNQNPQQGQNAQQQPQPKSGQPNPQDGGKKKQ